MYMKIILEYILTNLKTFIIVFGKLSEMLGHKARSLKQYIGEIVIIYAR